MGHIYCIGDENQKTVKIGYAESVPDRLQELQTGNPAKLLVHDQFIGTHANEKQFHKEHEGEALVGEWYPWNKQIKIAWKDLREKKDCGGATPMAGKAGIPAFCNQTNLNPDSLSGQIRSWIEQTKGWFTSRECDNDLDIKTKRDKSTRRQVLFQLVQNGEVYRHPSKQGVFRKPDTDFRKMDFSEALSEAVKIKLPLDIHKFCKLYPGNIIVVAGEKDAGKTAFAMNTVAMNMGLWKIHYFNSEMGIEELIVRLRNFEDIPFENWEKDVDFYERSGDFADVIASGRGNLNVIDYMEIHENHYLIGQWIKDIHDKLRGALCLIILQKPRGRDEGVGGEVTLQKPRLYVSLRKGVAKIISAKNRRDSYVNPNGLEMQFKLVGGSLFLPQDQWSLPEETNG